jgi:hypothetical protein
MLRTPFTRVSLIALTATLAAAPQAAFAQDAQAPKADEQTTGNQIIVTAQKIEQRALDVPITITATTGERIRELGVTDLDELSRYVPGLLIQEQSANNPGVVIRGITSDSGSAQQGPRVTLYYNGVDISRSRGSYQAIYDLDRVEVIKGPQATLFGTAAAVGAVAAAQVLQLLPDPGVLRGLVLLRAGAQVVHLAGLAHNGRLQRQRSVHESTHLPLQLELRRTELLPERDLIRREARRVAPAVGEGQAARQHRALAIARREQRHR